MSTIKDMQLLEWEGHGKTFSNKLWEFFNEGYLVDFSVTCHGQQIKVHKFVLVLMFPILKESLGPTTNCILDEEENTLCETMLSVPQGLNLDNIVDHAEDMDYLIQFAYTGKTIVPKEHTECLLRIADALDVNSLKDSLGQSLKSEQAEVKSGGNKTTPRNRLRTETQQNEVIHDQTRVYNVEYFEDYSKDDDDDKRSKKTKPKKKKVSKKGRIDSDRFNANLNEKANVETAELNPNFDAKSSKKRFMCKFCKKDVGSNNMLNIHRESKCGTKPFVCKYCDLKTLHKYAFLKHIMLKHLVDRDGIPLEKNVHCPKCDFVCHTKYHLRYHTRTNHDRQGIFLCKDCNFSASNMNCLMKHKRLNHENSDDFPCEECGKRYLTTSSLKRHISIIHKGIKPYKCDICDATYSCINSYKIHKESHYGNMESVCRSCGNRFEDKNALRIHMQQKHRLELKDSKS